jgi:anion-transporting  ArsA/GET3 family ATPase
LQAVPKIGSRILNAISNQAKKNLEELQEDIKDPTRIPQRLVQLPQDFAKEAKNVFLETPQGYKGPSYSVLLEGEGYEIREYAGYTVASTNMGKVGEPYSMNDLSTTGTAFNALAAYLFGANKDGKTLEMTTPVTTTSLGEMRFYLQENDAPPPLEDASMYEAGAVQIVDIPPARLAVRRFTGFVTEGEVARQKDTLLSQLEMDGVEIDVPHGAVVPHVIFQYNPPYTIPMVRRNEIAVPVVRDEPHQDLEAEWGQDNDDHDDNLSPSDVE